MADPYIPFGYNPPTLGGPPRRMRSLAEMGFMPPQFPTAEGGLMPQSPEEAADLQQQGQGMANMVQFAAPFALAGPVGAGARGLAALAGRSPRLATLLTGGSALTGQSTAAGPAKKKPATKTPAAPATDDDDAAGMDPQTQRLLQSDPLLRNLQTQIDAQNAIANAPAGNTPGSYVKSTRDGARVRASELQKDFNARLMELSRASLPFDQAYPWLAQNRALVALGAPAIAGYGARAGMNMLSRIGPARYERALRRADRALDRGNQQAYQHYMARAQRFEPGEHGRLARAAHATTPGLAGGALGLELSLLPYQHNITNAPLGSPQRQEAEQMLSDPTRWGPRAALGFGVGAIGGYGAGHLPNVSPGFRPPAGPPLTPIPPQSPPLPLPATPLPPAGPAATPLPPPGPGLASLETARRGPGPTSPFEPSPPPAPRGTRQAEGPPEGATWNPATKRWHHRGRMIGGADRWPAPPSRSWRDYPDE